MENMLLPYKIYAYFFNFDSHEKKILEQKLAVYFKTYIYNSLILDQRAQNGIHKGPTNLQADASKRLRVNKLEYFLQRQDEKKTMRGPLFVAFKTREEAETHTLFRNFQSIDQELYGGTTS